MAAAGIAVGQCGLYCAVLKFVRISALGRATHYYSRAGADRPVLVGHSGHHHFLQHFPDHGYLSGRSHLHSCDIQVDVNRYSASDLRDAD